MATLIGGITIPQLSGDPVGNPDANTVFLYSVGGSYRMKLPNGSIMTFATGVTPEDVQDIVGTFIQAGSNKLSITYNDVSNVLVIDVVPGNISHSDISNIGTNSHAQIDSHLANTSNPHNTTAGQVGADPSGSAAAAQAFSIQRSNHTGSQTSSTISDFSNTVLATILTGFVVGTNTAINAADTILQAFGKIQAQINNILSVLAAQVLGDNFEQFLDNTLFTTTSNANQIAASFTTTSKATGKYRIGINWIWRYASAANSAIFGVYIDGVLQDSEMLMELSDTAANERIPYSWFGYVDFATITTHTIELRVRGEAAGSALEVHNVRAEIWRSSP